MSKLWIYGDSFSTSREKSAIVYTNLLAEKLEADLIITAKGGSSLGWMMYKSMEDRYKFSENDYVIFQTTTLDRALLDKNRPGMAEYWKDCPDWKELSKEEQLGYTFYLTNIHDKEVLMLQFQSWLWSMSHYTQHLKIKPLITTAWDLGSFDVPENFRLCKGTLLDLSMGEFSGSYNTSIQWMLDNAGDPRHNHFSTINHNVVADLYFRAFTDNNFVPDLNQLHQNLYETYPEIGKKSWSGDWII